MVGKVSLKKVMMNRLITETEFPNVARDRQKTEGG